MSDPIDTFHDGDFEAADYVLGTLGSAERIAAARRMRRDRGFRAEVEAWELRLAPLAAAVPAVSPPPGIFEAVEAALPRAATARPAPAQVRTRDTRDGLVPAFWRWLALGSGALAAASLAGLAFLAVPAADPASSDRLQLAASITSEDGLPLFAVVLDPDENAATLVPIRLEPGPGQVPELWIVRDGDAPRSLGVFDAAQPLRLIVGADALDGDLSGGILAISLEPMGGSPTGQPTGPVVGHGNLHSI